MLNADLEINYLYEAVPLLDRYLGSKEVFWQLPGIAREPGFTFGALTIGVVLFMLKRLMARTLSDKLAAERGDYETLIFQSKIHNERLWMKKVGQDLSSRTRLWQTFLEEYRSDPLAAKNSYPNQVSQRVMVQLLWEEQDTGSLLLTPLQFMLQSMDAILKPIFVPGDFVWEEELQSGFSKDTFWYLYGSLK
ncbi:MAG: hypothetical protein WCF08_05670 [Anaerolineaceae bacterium]